MCKDTTSFEWFQSLLSSLESQSKKESTGGSEFLRIHTYLTQKLDADTAQNIVLNSVGTELDPLTELQSRTNFGRPNFKRFLTSMRDAINKGSYMPGMEGHLRTNVGVYFCGPSVAARDIRKACKAACTPEIDFSFWKEQYVYPFMRMPPSRILTSSSAFNERKLMFVNTLTRCASVSFLGLITIWATSMLSASVNEFLLFSWFPARGGVDGWCICGIFSVNFNVKISCWFLGRIQDAGHGVGYMEHPLHTSGHMSNK